MLYNTHAHITTWVIGIILFIVAVALFKKGLEKPTKIVHMTLRLFYVLIIITGAILFFQFSSIDPALYGIKFLAGIVVIGFAEMVLAKMKKGKNIIGMVIGLVISLLVTLYLGFGLPIGFNFLPL